MAQAQEKDDFEFEVEQDQDQVKGKETPDVDLEVVDDTPDEDKDPVTGKMREPMPEALVKELEADELEDYSDKVKTRLKQMKKVWHDERRAKEAALREQQEALSLAQRAIEENKKLKEKLTVGEQSYIDTAKSAAELEMEMAKKAYKDAYDSGDSDRLLEAQEKLSSVTYKLQKLSDFRPSLQSPEIDVNSEPEVVIPRPDQKTVAWQERNTWFGTEADMTALALGTHEKLQRQYGKQYVGTDEYWQNIDSTMRRRFPEYFGDEVQTNDGGGKPVGRTESKPATVVAPASRSTSSKKIVLKQSQLSIAKKLGLTPEQYAREYAKTMERN